MDPEHLKELAKVERSYWWTVAKSELCAELLARFHPPPGRLIEGGIGGGSNLQRFTELGYDALGLDASAAAVDHCRGWGLAAQVHDLQQPLPVDEGSADVIVLLDVLEHLPDPVAALRHCARALRPRGGLVLTVPAYPALMGPWDEMLGHLRRYTRTQLLAQAQQAGLHARWLSHWNAFSLPPAVLIRLRERFVSAPRSAEFPPVPAALNAALKLVARAERGLMRRVPLPLGVSLVGVLQR